VNIPVLPSILVITFLDIIQKIPRSTNCLYCL